MAQTGNQIAQPLRALRYRDRNPPEPSGALLKAAPNYPLSPIWAYQPDSFQLLGNTNTACLNHTRKMKGIRQHQPKARAKAHTRTKTKGQPRLVWSLRASVVFFWRPAEDDVKGGEEDPSHDCLHYLALGSIDRSIHPARGLVVVFLRRSRDTPVLPGLVFGVTGFPQIKADRLTPRREMEGSLLEGCSV